MKMRLALVAGVALIGLTAEAAWADNNEAYTTQDGTGNSVDIRQFDSDQKESLAQKLDADFCAAP